jgi:hypothetical protein
MLLAVVMGLWLLSPHRAAAQIIDPGDIELPDPPDVDPPDVDLPDADLPDVELPDVEPPDPPDDPPGDDDPDDDPDDNPPGDDDPGDPGDPGDETESGEGRRDGDGKKGAGHSSGSGDGPGDKSSVVPSSYAQLAAARGHGDLVIVPSKPDSHSLSRPDDGDRGLMELLAPLGFPMLLMVAVGAFLTLQDHLDRRDPRRLLSVMKTHDQL